MASIEIHAAQTTSGNSPKALRRIEKLTQTFLAGVPVMVDSVDGGIKEWTGTVATDKIAGFSSEPASNLSATGTGAPGVLTPVLGLGSTSTFGSVPYQTSAKNIPRGGPFNDGRIGIEVAAGDSVFAANVGPAQTTVETDVGVGYGMTKDADNHWYVDRTKTAANACVTIKALHPLDGPKLGGRVLMTVNNANAQIFG